MEISEPPEDGTELELGILTLETRGALKVQTWVMTLTLRCKLVLIAIFDILPWTVFNNSEESLNQSARGLAVSEIRTL